MEHADTKATETDTNSSAETTLNAAPSITAHTHTAGLITQLVRVLSIYKDLYGLITTEDKETEEQLIIYHELFAATERDRIQNVHTDLLLSIFQEKAHEYIGMPHRLKLKLDSLQLKDIELGSNLFDTNGKSKNRGVYLPLGPIWRMSAKLRKNAKEMIAAGSSKIDQKDLTHTGMHQILYFIVQHLKTLMGDEKAERTATRYAGFIHQYRILCEKENDGRPSFSDAMTKVKGMMSGPVLQQIISAVGIDVDPDEIEEITSKVFGGDGEENSASMESLFDQISSGNLDPNSITGLINTVTDAVGTGGNENDDYDDSDDDLGIDDYDEHIEYEDVD